MDLDPSAIKIVDIAASGFRDYCLTHNVDPMSLDLTAVAATLRRLIRPGFDAARRDAIVAVNEGRYHLAALTFAVRIKMVGVEAAKEMLACCR